MTPSSPSDSLLQTLSETVAAPGASEDRLSHCLELIAGAFGAESCTLHAVRDEPTVLHLEGAIGLPDVVRDKVITVPFGKGMAGICAERRSPVSVCNVQTDTSGVVRPGAKETPVCGAVVVPVLAGDSVVGTIGVGRANDEQYSADEEQRLVACGEILVEFLRGSAADRA